MCAKLNKLDRVLGLNRSFFGTVVEKAGRGGSGKGCGPFLTLGRGLLPVVMTGAKARVANFGLGNSSRFSWTAEEEEEQLWIYTLSFT